MAKLFRHVVDRCDDEQIAKYDEVLCQLAEIVEAEARADVAEMLAPLSRAPGSVVIMLANDKIEVAAPLLEFSSVLSDDDLIEIVQAQSEGHPLCDCRSQSGHRSCWLRNREMRRQRYGFAFGRK